MNTSFEVQVTVVAQANYGAFRGSDHRFYKPTGALKPADFEVGKTYSVKGYMSESGKTLYVTEIVNNTAAATPERILPPPPAAKTIPGDAPSLNKPTGRDFTKEAKGKTFSLIVAGLCHHLVDSKEILKLADELLKGIEDRNYF